MGEMEKRMFFGLFFDALFLNIYFWSYEFSVNRLSMGLQMRKLKT